MLIIWSQSYQMAIHKVRHTFPAGCCWSWLLYFYLQQSTCKSLSLSMWLSFEGRIFICSSYGLFNCPGKWRNGDHLFTLWYRILTRHKHYWVIFMRITKSLYFIFEENPVCRNESKDGKLNLFSCHIILNLSFMSTGELECRLCGLICRNLNQSSIEQNFDDHTHGITHE